MKTQDEIGIVFANTVIGRGILNGVINLSFSAFNFTPTDDGKQVDLDPVVVSRLRMDRICATQLRDVMNELLASIEKAEADLAMGVKDAKVDGVIAKPAARDIN